MSNFNLGSLSEYGDFASKFNTDNLNNLNVSNIPMDMDMEAILNSDFAGAGSFQDFGNAYNAGGNFPKTPAIEVDQGTPWFGKGGMAMPLIQGASSLANAWMGFKNLGLQKDLLNFKKDAFNTNIAKQEDTIRGRLTDRHAADVAAYGADKAGTLADKFSSYGVTANTGKRPPEKKKPVPNQPTSQYQPLNLNA